MKPLSVMGTYMNLKALSRVLNIFPVLDIVPTKSLKSESGISVGLRS